MPDEFAKPFRGALAIMMRSARRFGDLSANTLPKRQTHLSQLSQLRRK
jgi:hypothetical protein